MKDYKEEYFRVREELNSLKDENRALSDALKNKEEKIAEMISNQAVRDQEWQDHLTRTSEAIEEAAEAQLRYEQARADIKALQEEFGQLIKQLKKALK